MSLAALAAAALACTTPTFKTVADRDAKVDDEGDADDEDTITEEEEDATTAEPVRATDAASPINPRMDASQATGGGSDGAALPTQDAGEPASEAGTVIAMQADDAGNVSALPDWVRPLIGTYAKRSVAFSYDTFAVPPINTRNIEDTIVTFSEKDDGLEVSIQLCSYEVQQQEALPFYLKNAATTPPLKGRIMLGAGNTFSSEPLTHQLGFNRGRACSAGTSRMKYGDQSWITGSSQCQCSAARLPDALNDCRITDGDGDGKAGITGRGQFVSAANTDVVMVLEYTLTWSDGHVTSDGTATLRELRTQGQSCLDYAHDYCNLGNNQVCPGGTTKLIGPAPVTCADFPASSFGQLPSYPDPAVDCR